MYSYSTIDIILIDFPLYIAPFEIHEYFLENIDIFQTDEYHFLDSINFLLNCLNEFAVFPLTKL